MFPKAILLALVGAASTAVAAPSLNDKGLLQFALTLEHLENSFFSDGLARYTKDDFVQAGFPSWVRGRFRQIADNEATHVALLQEQLGADAPAACKYNFGYKDVQSFVELAAKIETIGAGTYLGLARHIDNKSTLNIGAAIAATEARQAGWISSSVLKNQPWDGAVETPIPPTVAWSLFRGYISDCPKTNPDLPLVTLPGLKVSNSKPNPGDTIKLEVKLGSSKKTLYAAWLDGLDVKYTKITDNKTKVPQGLSGTVYVGVVSSKERPDRDNLVTGFTTVEFPFDSKTRQNAA
ncbi:ferritin-like domain-containing protein [Trametes meyenii]|nr:ferritin-like domain-containing protein [Trametes meyenii]